MGVATDGGVMVIPASAKLLVQQADPLLPNAQDMSLLATGIVKNTTGTGVQIIATPDVDYATPSLVNQRKVGRVGPVTPAQQNVTFSSLDGNADGGYVMFGTIKNDNAGSSVITFKINGAVWTSQIRGSNTGAALDKDTSGGITMASGDVLSFEIKLLKAQTGLRRIGHGTAELIDSTGAIKAQFFSLMMVYSNTATNVTSLGLSSDQTDGIGVNSDVTLVKVAS
jgi:hypothetical protein